MMYFFRKGTGCRERALFCDTLVELVSSYPPPTLRYTQVRNNLELGKLHMPRCKGHLETASLYRLNLVKFSLSKKYKQWNAYVSFQRNVTAQCEKID
jgi:hypothetical protein